MDARNPNPPNGSSEWSTNLIHALIEMSRTLGRLEAQVDHNREIILLQLGRIEATLHAKLDTVATIATSMRSASDPGPASLIKGGLKLAERASAVLSVIWPALLWLIPRAVSMMGLWLSVWEGWWMTAWHWVRHLGRLLFF